MDRQIKIKDKSTISIFEYLLGFLILGSLIFIWYKGTIFVRIDGRSAVVSLMILLLCFNLSLWLGFLVRVNRYMTKLAVFSDVFISTGVYTLIAYKGYYKAWFTFIYIAIAVGCVWTALIEFFKPVKGKRVHEIEDRYIRGFIIYGKTLRTISTSLIVTGIIMLVMTFPIIYNRCINSGLIVADTKIVSDKLYGSDYDIEDTSVANNMRTALLIRNELTWNTLEVDEKLSVLQWVCNMECDKLGIGRLQVVLDRREKGVLGAYDEVQRIIIIDSEHIKNDGARDCLTTIFHEVNHGYQYRITEFWYDSTVDQRRMAVFSQVPSYIREMRNYKDGGETEEEFREYYNQVMERESREYSERRVNEFYAEVDSYSL